MDLSRRRLLQLFGLGAAVAVVPPSVVKLSVRDYVEEVVRHKLRPLEIPDDVMERFLDAYEVRLAEGGLTERFRRTYTERALHRMWPALNIGGLSTVLGRKEDDIVLHFALSTNLLSDARVPRGEEPIAWTGFWEITAPNRNPFADLTPPA